MKLIELFSNSHYEHKWLDRRIAIFLTDDYVYTVNFNVGYSNPPIFIVEFGAFERPNDINSVHDVSILDIQPTKTSLINTHNSVKIFSTIGEILKDFIASHPDVAAIVYDSADDKRDKRNRVYRKMLSRLPGFSPIDLNGGSYQGIRSNKYSDEDFRLLLP